MFFRLESTSCEARWRYYSSCLLFAKVRIFTYLCDDNQQKIQIMKHFFLSCVAFFFSSQIVVGNTLDIKSITSGEFTSQYISGINPVSGTDLYAMISQDGRQILQYSFKTGKQVSVLFDVNNTNGQKISDFDDYILSPDGKKILICTQKKPIYRRSFSAVYYIYTIASRKLETLSDGGPQQVPTWSPDGQQVAFVRDNNIFLVKLLYDNAETQVTQDGKTNEIINGIPDWVNEEEFSFNKSLVFNADGTMICWIKYNESKVKTYSLQMFQGRNPALESNKTYPGFYSYKYPKAGEENAAVTVWSYDIQSRQTRQLAVPSDKDGYMPRIKATSDPSKILVYTLNRHQDRLSLYTVNPKSTVAQLLLKEQIQKYVKDETISNISIYKNAFLLLSDREGFMQLYLYDMAGQLQRKIGDGKSDITSVYGYNEATGDVYYQSASLHATDRQVYVSHKNGKVERLTNQEGWNNAIFSGDYQYFINTWSDAATPYVFTVRDNKGKVLSTLLDNSDLKNKLSSYQITSPEFFTFTTSEGVQLNGWMLKPKDFNSSKKYPVIMFQYSGPGSQQVVNSWSVGSMGQGALFDNYLAQQGFIVVCVDGRGTGGRGSDFEKSTYLRLGQLESKDQVEAALYLGSLPYVDKRNIGIWGWSYGGFNTLMSISDGRQVFKAGVAVAAPTDFRYYDTVYTERYMRTPQENKDGYDDNPINRAGKMNAALLLCHGLADDNVHPQNMFEYSEALVQADKDFKELVYTNRNHGIYGGNTRNHLLRQIADFFKSELQGGTSSK